MMDFTPEILSLENAVSYLKEVLRMPLEKLDKKQTRRVFDKLTRVIDDVYYIDDLMPLEEFADKFTDRKDRDAFFRVLDLLEESFSLLDELLGPAEEWEDSEETVEEVVEHRLEAKGRKVTAADDGTDEGGEEDDGEDPWAKLLRNIKPNRHAS